METVKSLLDRYEVDTSHAQHVAALAVQLFDETRAVHQLDARARVLLEAGALLHNVGVQVDDANHHTVGRDIVVGAKLTGFNTAERNSLACMVAFHRKAVQPEGELLFRVLNEKQQRTCLALSALLRIADGLDYSGTQTTLIKKLRMKNEDLSKGDANLRSPNSSISNLICVGPHSYEDAARAQKKSDLWVSLFGALQISGQIKTPGLTPDDTLAVAGRKLMRYWFAREVMGCWLLAGDDTSSANKQHPITKKLRVAARRLRSMVLVFGECYKPKHTRALFEGLRNFARCLGVAREADVLLERVSVYVAACDPDSQTAFSPFVEALTLRQAEAYDALHTYARGTAHQKWVKGFAAFVSQSSSKADRELDADTPSRVRHAARMWLWQHVASVRAFDVLGDKPAYAQVHAARMAVNRLRYLAEGLSEVLPEHEISEWVTRCKQAQAALGALNDAHMACEQAQDFVQSAQDAGRPVHTKAIETYAHEQARLAETQLMLWRTHLAPLFESD